jgi:septal ring factor EnvC (AmiA/AmiB activator)
MNYFVFIIVLFITVSVQAADSVPTPGRKQLSLQTLKSAAEHEKVEQKKIETEIKQTEKSLQNLREKLVTTAKEEQKISGNLQTLEKKKETLSLQEQLLTTKLSENKDKIAFLVTSLSKMQLKPNALYLFEEREHQKQVLINASFKHMVPDIIDEAKAVQKDLQTLDSLRKSLGQKEKQIEIEQKKLAGNQSQLEKLITQRTSTYNENKERLAESKKQAALFASQAKTMEDLLAKLQTTKPTLSKKPHYTEKLPVIGNKRLPVAGVLKVGYGSSNDIGAKSQGIEISAATGITAVAPMGGRIRFIGSFKTYKNLMIIEHANEYHSLISGLENISVELGQSVLAGEPLGVIGDSQTGSSVLYYELRYKGHPVDPLK